SDGRRFDAVGTVASKDQEGGSTYSMKLGGLGSNNYYRLKMMHLDGSYVYGPVLSLGGGACGSAAIAASPVPATDVVSISGLGATAGSIRIYNSMGTLVAQMEATQPTQSVSIAGYASGSYLLRVMSREGAELGSVRIVKE